MDPEAVDAEIVPDEEVPIEVADPIGTPSTGLMRVKTQEVVRPLDPDALVDSFREYQALLPRLLTEDDWQQAGRDRFVKKSGWRKIATAFNLDVLIVESSIERDEDGSPLRAKVIARAVAPNGRTMDGDGYCDVREKRFSGPRGNKEKVENDLRATATTRAKNRAIADLVGMGAVSAEEVDSGPSAGPPYGEALDAGQMERVRAGTRLLIDAGAGLPVTDEEDVIAQLVEDASGYMPRIVGRAILRLAVALRQNDITSQEGEPDGDRDDGEAGDEGAGAQED